MDIYYCIFSRMVYNEKNHKCSFYNIEIRQMSNHDCFI